MVPIYDATGNIIGYVPPRSRPAPGAGSKETASLGDKIDQELFTTTPSVENVLPTSLPDASKIPEGTIAVSNTSGKRYVVIKGQWQPL
jgi:hypothetical protein